MKHFKTLLKVSNWRISNLNMGALSCLIFLLSFILAATVNINEVYAAGKTLTAISPLNQQIKLSQRSAIVPGGRGFMLPQSVVLKDAEGKPIAGEKVTFEVASNDQVSSSMRGGNSVFCTTTNARGIAIAANTDSSYAGEGFQVFSINEAVVTTLKLKVSAEGCDAVTFNVEVGTYGSNITDVTPPIVTYTLKDDTGADYIEGTWTNHPVTVAYSAVDTLSSILSCTEPQVFSEEGANQNSKGTAIDTVGQKTEVNVGPINIDKSAPVTKATTTGKDTWNNDTVNIQFNSTDSISGVEAIYYKIGNGSEMKVDASNSITIDTDGLNDMSYWAVDKAGNKEEPKTISSKIDKSAPTVTTELSPPRNDGGWNNSDVKVLIKATDTNSGVKEIHYQIGDTGTEQTVNGDSADFSVYTEGITNVTFWAVDNTGNVSTKDKLEVRIDKSKPTIKVPKDILIEATAVKTPIDIGTASFQDVSGVKLTNDAPKEGFPIGATKVTWTAEDSVGNKNSDVQTVTVKDTTKPLLSVQGDIVVEATGIKTHAIAGPATATDIFKVTVTNDAPYDFPMGKTLVKWTAVDANGNSVSVTQNVIVIDSTKPVLSIPANITEEATAIRTPVDIGMATATDIFKVKIENNAPEDFPLGKTDVTWKATDENGNVTTGVQEIVIKDTIKPELTVPKDMTLEATKRKMTPDIGQAVAKDAFKVTLKNDAPEYYPVGTTKVTWTAMDENGNVTVKEQNITITDTIAPVLKIAESMKDINAEATGINTPVDIGTPDVSDIFEIKLTNNAPANNIFPLGNTVITWIATDENGNSSTAIQNICVEDKTKPVLKLPDDMKIEATAVRTPVSVGNATATDVFKVELKNDAPEDYPIGTTKVTWTAIDENGNKATGVQNVTVVDTTKPVITLPDNMNVEAAGIKTPVSIGIANAKDIFKVTFSSNAPKDYPLGTTKVTWTATDENGNTATGVQLITVKDTTEPLITLPSDITKEATAIRTRVVTGTATATDIFKVTLKNDAPADYPVGITKVTWTATDENGNISTKVQNITITDKTKPVIHKPDDVIQEAAAIRTPVKIGEATATDIFEVTVESNAPADYPLGTTAVTWTATDKNGNTSTAVQNITVVDKTPPVLVVPKDLTVEATAVKTPVNIGAATASDIFKITGITSNAPAEYPLGTTVVKWTVTDENGNVSTAEQKITVRDTTAPVIKAPSDITTEATGVRTPVSLTIGDAIDIFKTSIQNDAPLDFPLGTTVVTWRIVDENGNVTIVTQKVTIADTTKPVLKVPEKVMKEATAVNTPVNIGEATATDIFKVTISNDAPKAFAIGTTKVTWTATDENGNVSAAEQEITVTDTTKPVLKVPESMTTEATALRTPVASIGKATATDIFKVVIKNDAPSEYPLGTTKVTWTATDENGNVATAEQNITITDTTKPVIKVPAAVKAEATGIKSPVSIGGATATDIFKVAIKNDAPADYPIGTTKVTWAATDENGNVSTGEQAVTIEDTTKPVLEIPEDVKLEATAVRTPVVIGKATATDIFKVTVTCDAPEDFPVGTTKVTWTATDENGNVAIAVQNITVTDTTKPVLNVPSEVKTEATAVKTPVSIGEATATDIFKVVIKNDAPKNYPIGTTKVTWTATDENGNVTIGEQLVTITDTTKPVLEVPAEVKAEATAISTPVSLGEATATDIFKVTVKNDAPSDYPVGIKKVTWTATDENGNVSTGEQLVTIADTTKPVLEIPKDIIAEATAVRTSVSLGEATATDIFKVTVKNDAPADYPVGVTKVTWTATDANGNVTTAVQNVTITDTTKPVLKVPAEVKMEATAIKTPVSIGQAEAKDIFKVTVKSDAPEAYPVGTTKVTWTAADENGNVSTGEQLVTITDTTKPVLKVPVSIATEATGLKTSVDIGGATATDIFKVTITNDAPDYYLLGSKKVIWTATDENGNVTTAEQNITITDTTKPVLKVPEDISTEATAVKTPVSIGKATATDIYKVVLKNNAPEVYPVGTTKVKWTATDENGNETTAEQSITITDTTKPVLKIPEDVKATATDIKTPVKIGEATATDIFKAAVKNDAPEAFPVGATKVTWTATDENGNITTAVQNVTLILPEMEFKVPGNIKVEATAVKTPVYIGEPVISTSFKMVVKNDAPEAYPIGITKVTWTATDVFGRVKAATQLVEVVDTTKPVLKVPGEVKAEATAVKSAVNIGEALATDIFKVAIKNDAPVGYPVGTTKVTWTATDENGNITTAEQLVTITDTTKPVLKVSADVKMEATAVRTPVKLGEAIATDIFKVKLESNAPADYPVGTTKVIWTATDENGNVTTGEQLVTITDTTKPVLEVPAEVKTEATAVKTPVSTGEAKASDIFKVTVKNDAPEVYPIGTTKVIWTATDENGNVTTGEQFITITDTTKPVLEVPAEVKTEATAVKTPVSIGEAKASDIFKVTVKSDAPEAYPIGTTKVIWTATDENGNVTTGEQLVTITDTTKPVLEVPAEVKLEATAVKTPATIGAAKSSDIFKVTVKNDAPEAYPIGTTKVTWTATDENGNVSSAVQNVTITDTTKPVLKVPAEVKKEATAVRTPVSIGQVEVSDIFKVVIKNDAPEVYPVGTTKVIWTATDENGNTSTGEQLVTITDTTKPELKVPEAVNMEATAVKTPAGIGEATAADIFKVAVKSDAPAEYPIGTTKVTWTATDENGNVTTGEQLVTIKDTTKPELKVPEAVNMEATAVKTPAAIGEATAADIFKVTVKSDAPADYPIGTTKVTWTATDENGNVTMGEQLVTIKDTTKPELKVPEAVNMEATAVKTHATIGEATAADIFKVEVKSDALVEYPIGTTKVTWTATDENGNVTTAVQYVTITDTTKPVMKVPAAVNAEATSVKTPVSIGQVEVSDIFKVVIKCDAPETYPVGTTKVTWTATDENGNASTGEQLITITDTTKPVLEVPAEVTTEATAVNTPVSIGEAKASDIFKVTIKSDAPADYPIGTTKVTWTATDENGNVTTGEQLVTIKDTTKPELKVPDAVNMEATAVKTPTAIGEATAADIFKVTVKSDAPADYPIGTTKVTWTATDENGNVTTGEQLVTIKDTTKPELKVPAAVNMEATAVKTPADIGEATVADIFKVTVKSDAPADYPIGTTKVTWTATDENGNVTTGEQLVTIKDTTKPELKVPAAVNMEATAVRTPADIGEAEAADIFKVTVKNDAPDEYPVGTTKVTWTATDENGNVTTGEQLVTIKDTTKPMLEIPADVNTKATALKTPVSLGEAKASDIFKVTIKNDAPDEYPVGTTKVTWTATDENGNVTAAVQNITITLPDLELKAPEDITTEATALKTPVSIGKATATSISTVTIKNDAPDSYPIDTTKVTWTATDIFGTVRTAVQNITIIDTTKPVITKPADVTVPATGARTKVSIGKAAVSDIFHVILLNDAPADFPVGTTKVTWTATDANGNVSTAVQNITVIQNIRIRTFNNSRAATVNTLDPKFEIENISNSNINLSDLKIRYYYTVDGDKNQTYWCDYAQVYGTSGQRSITSAVTGTFKKATAKPQSDYYLEISFNSTAGTLKPGDKINIHGRFSKADWSNYTQTNDYSFNASATEYTESSKVTVYSSGILIAGTEP